MSVAAKWGEKNVKYFYIYDRKVKITLLYYLKFNYKNVLINEAKGDFIGTCTGFPDPWCVQFISISGVALHLRADENECW